MSWRGHADRYNYNTAAQRTRTAYETRGCRSMWVLNQKVEWELQRGPRHRGGMMLLEERELRAVRAKQRPGAGLLTKTTVARSDC